MVSLYSLHVLQSATDSATDCSWTGVRSSVLQYNTTFGETSLSRTPTIDVLAEQQSDCRTIHTHCHPSVIRWPRACFM